MTTSSKTTDTPESGSHSGSLSGSLTPPGPQRVEWFPGSPSPSEGNHSASPPTPVPPTPGNHREPPPQKTALEQVTDMQRAGTIRLCRTRGELTEDEAQILVDFADLLTAAGARDRKDDDR